MNIISALFGNHNDIMFGIDIFIWHMVVQINKKKKKKKKSKEQKKIEACETAHIALCQFDDQMLGN